MKKNLVKILNKQGVLERGLFKLSNGKESNIYFDIKKAYGSPEALKMLSDSLYKIMDKSITCVASSGLGGNPLATSISINKGINLTIIREKEKNHGKGGVIEYYLPNEKDKVAIVDDVFTTGGNLNKIIKILTPTGANMVGCYVIVKRGKNNLNLPLKYLLIPEDFY